jgi:hypothetical protein
MTTENNMNDATLEDAENGKSMNKEMRPGGRRDGMRQRAGRIVALHPLPSHCQRFPWWYDVDGDGKLDPSERPCVIWIPITRAT